MYIGIQAFLIHCWSVPLCPELQCLLNYRVPQLMERVPLSVAERVRAAPSNNICAV